MTLPYIYQEFPKWKYHPDKEPKIVDDHDSELALGADWFDSPQEAQAALLKMKEAVEASSVEPIKRGPGRPPSNPIHFTDNRVDDRH